MLPLVRAGALLKYKELLQNFGVDAESLLKQLNLPADYIDKPDRLIPLALKVELLELGAQLSNRPDFGLKLAQMQDLSVLGVIGLLMRQSDTMREALGSIASHICQHVQELDIWLDEQGDLAFLHFKYRLSSASANSRQHIDNTLVHAFNILNTLSNRQLKLRAVYLSGDAPESVAPYAQLLNAPVAFGNDSNTLVFDRSYLDLSVHGADPILRRLLKNHLQTTHRDDFEGKVRWIIANFISRQAVTLNEVADSLGIAPRTLQSKLTSQSLTFQQILDEERINQVCSYMAEGSMTLTDISELVGYSQLSALTRCFKKVKGCTPGQWRKLNTKERG